MGIAAASFIAAATSADWASMCSVTNVGGASSMSAAASRMSTTVEAGIGGTSSAKEDLGHVVELVVDELQHAGRFRQGHAHDAATAQRHHLTERTVVDRVDGGDAEPGGEHAIE